MESKCIFYCIFELRGFIGSSLWKVSHLSTFGIFLLTFIGVSLRKVVVPFLIFSKSSSLLKTEFVCKRYRVFRMCDFAVLQIRSCSGLLRPEQWPGTHFGVQAGATPGSTLGCSGMTKKSVTVRFLRGYKRGLLPQIG
jgi:hypothetical protein